MSLFLSTILLAASIAVPGGPVRFPPQPTFPDLTAKEWIVYDPASGTTLMEYNSHEERPMASVTKVMTALVVRDRTNLDDRVRVSDRAATVSGSEIGLMAGEVWSVRDLLAAMLVRSGNDAAVALAEHVAGSVPAFAALMNAKAAELGLEESHFLTPHGLDVDGQYTSAHDLAIIASVALQDPVIAQLVRTRLVRFKPAPSGADRIVHNTNALLGRYPGIVGLKTGFTNKAGRVLISAFETDGRTLITVVMGSEDHFADTRELVDYISNRITVRDRFLRPLLERQGGGGIPAPGIGQLEERILATLPPLADGRESLTPFEDTPGSRAVVEWLRSVLPVTLGGAGE